MVERRAVVGGGLVAGLTALMGESSAEAAPAPAVTEDGQQISGSIDQLRRTFESQFDQSYAALWRGVGRVRQQQRQWLRSTQKYPDFLDIGVDVWDNVYDWHVAHQQPLRMERAADGRYTMVFMFTTLVLRPEQAPDYVGFPFDADARRTRVP
jgi:hypothetical protein